MVSQALGWLLGFMWPTSAYCDFKRSPRGHWLLIRGKIPERHASKISNRKETLFKFEGRRFESRAAIISVKNPLLSEQPGLNDVSYKIRKFLSLKTIFLSIIKVALLGSRYLESLAIRVSLRYHLEKMKQWTEVKAPRILNQDQSPPEIFFKISSSQFFSD